MDKEFSVDFKYNNNKPRIEFLELKGK